MKEMVGAAIALIAGLAGSARAAADAAPVVFRPGRAEVVIPDSACDVVRFAAAEATNFLSRVLDAEVPLVHSFTPGRTALVLGTNAWSRAAGVCPEGLPWDSFVVKAEWNRVYVAGCDDPAVRVEDALNGAYWQQMFERATLFGVYEFLERYAGCRFYFAHELGEIVPRRDSVAVPAGAYRRSPEFAYWSYQTFWDGAWIGEGPVPQDAAGRYTATGRGRVLNLWRLRGSSFYVPYAHGLNQFHYLRRFGKTHPEYFQLQGNRRRVDPSERHYGQLCHSSAVNEEIKRDVLSYLRGEPASVRGIPASRSAAAGEFGWNRRNPYGPYVCVMPQDGMGPCSCSDCQKAYDMKDADGYASELIWSKTAELARHVTAAGFTNAVLTQMAYTPYATVPKCELPPNVDVQLARLGPWVITNPTAWQKQKDTIRQWSEKVGHRISLWTYPLKGYGNNLKIPEVPQMTPKAWGAFYKEVAPWISGGFAESGSDRFFFNHLNYYVYSRIAWDNSVDVAAVLDEYYRLMFGAAAADVRAVYDELERKWLCEIAGNFRDTPLGPMAIPPSEHEIWTKTYGAKVLADFRGRFDRAAARLDGNSVEVRRLALVRDELLGALERGSRAYLDSISVEKELERRAARPNRVSLVSDAGFNKAVRDRSTFVSGPDSIRLDATDRPSVSCTHYFDGKSAVLKPATKYRLSYFVKTANVQPTDMKGGAVVIVNDGKNHRFPFTAAISGTLDWIHREFVFTTLPTASEKPCYVRLFLSQSTGTAWFDGVELTEVE